MLDPCGAAEFMSAYVTPVESPAALGRPTASWGRAWPAIGERTAVSHRTQDAAEDRSGYDVTTSTTAVVRFVACSAHVQRVREQTRRTVGQAGADEDLQVCAELVVSELIGNAVAACGDGVELAVALTACRQGVTVAVHDPLADRLPRPTGVRLDDPDAEAGRGLGLLDLIAPGWRVLPSPLGKQIVCRLTRVHL